MESNLNNKEQKTIGSVIKAIEIIELLASTDEELGATEISNILSYGVSATYHILITLKKSKIIEQDNKTKKYRLGLKLWKIGKMAREQNRLSFLIKPYLERLRDMTGETSNLTILDNAEIVYIEQEESNKLIRMFTKIGARIPLHCSAAGKVLLAFKPKEKQDSIIRSINFNKFTEQTLTERKKLKRQLDFIREKGYAFDHEERELGVSCIAAPIHDFDGEVIAAISISGPTSRFDEDSEVKFIKCILEVTKEVSEYLGFQNK